MYRAEKAQWWCARPWRPALLAALLAVACDSGDPARSDADPATSAAARPSEPPPPPPTKSEEVSFEAEDGVTLFGRFFKAEPEAPLLVLVHRFRGDRSEWDPIVQRLSQSDKRYNMIQFDLRGHGKSLRGSNDDTLTWAELEPKDMPLFTRDVRAAIDFGKEQTGAKSRAVVLVGSSLGGAIAAQVAGERQSVAAIGLISPGAAINGYDVYERFARVRSLPSFVAGASNDNVVREPLRALGEMGKEAATVKKYTGSGHAASGLLREENDLLADLEAWLMKVFERRPTDRETVEPESPGGEKKEKR